MNTYPSAADADYYDLGHRDGRLVRTYEVEKAIELQVELLGKRFAFKSLSLEGYDAAKATLIRLANYLKLNT